MEELPLFCEEIYGSLLMRWPGFGKENKVFIQLDEILL